VEALHDANTADGREPPLYPEVRKRLEQGTLTPPPKEVQVKKATREHTCVVCQQVIRPGRVQNDFRAYDGARSPSIRSACASSARKRSMLMKSRTKPPSIMAV